MAENAVIICIHLLVWLGIKIYVEIKFHSGFFKGLHYCLQDSDITTEKPYAILIPNTWSIIYFFCF